MATSAQDLELGREEGKAYALGQDYPWVSQNREVGGGANIGHPAVAGWTL